jgi:hypothetical protein
MRSRSYRAFIVAPAAQHVSLSMPQDKRGVLLLSALIGIAPPRTAANGTAAWRAQILIAYGVRVRRVASALALDLPNEWTLWIREHIYASLTAEHVLF